MFVSLKLFPKAKIKSDLRSSKSPALLYVINRTESSFSPPKIPLPLVQSHHFGCLLCDLVKQRKITQNISACVLTSHSRCQILEYRNYSQKNSVIGCRSFTAERVVTQVAKIRWLSEIRTPQEHLEANEMAVKSNQVARDCRPLIPNPFKTKALLGKIS